MRCAELREALKSYRDGEPRSSTRRLSFNERPYNA